MSSAIDKIDGTQWKADELEQQDENTQTEQVGADVRLFRFVRDLTGEPESQIKYGRWEQNKADHDEQLISIDILGNINKQSSNFEFDPVNELEQHSASYTGTATITFFGKGAMDRATRFSLINHSYEAYALCAKHKINVLAITNIVNVGFLTGQQIYEQVQVTMNFIFNNAITIQRDRMDVIELNIKKEEI